MSPKITCVYSYDFFYEFDTKTIHVAFVARPNSLYCVFEVTGCSYSSE